MPNFSQFSPLHQSIPPQQSPSPFGPPSMIGMGNENVTLPVLEFGPSGMGMGFPLGGEDPTICMDSPTKSDADMRLRSLSSSGASVSGSVQDLTLSRSHSSIVGTNHCHNAVAGGGSLAATDSVQSLVSLDNAPPPPPPFSSFIPGSSNTAVSPALSLCKTSTTQSHLNSDSTVATSLIEKPPSLLNDPCELHLVPSASSLTTGHHDPSLLASASVHHVETLPNTFTKTGSSSNFYHHPPVASQEFPLSVASGAPLPLPGGSFPQFGSSTPSYHCTPQGSGSFVQHGQDLALPVSNSPLHFAVSSYPSTSLSVPPPSDPSKHDVRLPPSSLPTVHVDSELARVDEYMQKYLSESHSQESLKNGTNTAILNATKEHDRLISQVLLMSPEHSNERRSSGATTAMFLSVLEGMGNNGRVTPLATAAVAATPSSTNHPHEQRPTRKESTDNITANDGLRSPLQRHDVISTSTADTRHPNSSSTASTSSSEASPLASNSRTNIHDHHRETISDTSSGVSSASTKFSTTTCSSGQSSPIDSASPSTILNSPSSVSPSPILNDNFSYNLVENGDRERKRTVSQDSSSEGLLDQIYEPYPALSSDEGEYMVESPDLRPPPPPKMKGKIDLHPKVPIYEVGVCVCVCV